MIELDFAVTGAHPDLTAAGPTVTLTLHIGESTGAAVYALALRVQVRIEPVRRTYDDTEAAALRDLFGERARWGDTLKPMQVGFIDHMVPSFTGERDVELALPCSFDMNVAANKYFYGVDNGEVPLLLLFSGTAFATVDGVVSVQPVPWHKEARFRLPVGVWQQTMDLHFPGAAWAQLDRETFDALHRYRSREQLRDADEAVRRLLKEAGET